MVSVNHPAAWRDQLDTVLVGITEIDADAAERPMNFTLDRYAFLGESALAIGQGIGGDLEREVQPSCSAMRRDDSVRGVHGLECAAFLEQQQHGVSGHGRHADAIISSQPLEFEQALVEGGG